MRNFNHAAMCPRAAADLRVIAKKIAAFPGKKCLPPTRPPQARGFCMSASLMTTRRFAPLFWCQFFSAFNDNFLKNALVLLILFRLGGAGAGALLTLAGRL